jgi:hypothetical protein
LSHGLSVSEGFKLDIYIIMNQVETSERAAIVLQSAWRRKEVQTNLLHSLVDIIMVQSVARRYLSKDEVQGRQNEVKSLQIRARFDSYFLPTFGDMWRDIASAEDDDVTSTTRKVYDTNSSLVSSVAESDGPEPNHRLTRKELRALARRNAQRFGIGDKARADATKQESYAARRLISSREEENANCFSDSSEEEDFLALMKELHATKTIRMSTLATPNVIDVKRVQRNFRRDNNQQQQQHKFIRRMMCMHHLIHD